MKISHLKQALPIIVLILILTSVYWVNFQSTHTVKGLSCHLSGGKCATVAEQSRVTLVVHDELQIEEELHITLSFPNHLKLRQSWVEGTNMFMGRFIVDLMNVDNEGQVTKQHGVFFLGSCSEPKMEWKLVAELDNSTNGNRVYREFLFSTRQY